jgi:hypothetical protein
MPTLTYWEKLTLVLVVLATACGAQGDVMIPTVLEPVTAKESLKTPSVRLVSPPVWSAGEVVTVLGADFVAPERGYTIITLEGQYKDVDGQASNVAMRVKPAYRNPGKVDFTFEPAYPPAGFGSQIGTFTGQISAVNADEESASPASSIVNASVEVGPSLILWTVRPEDHPCADEPRVTTTLDKTKMTFDVEVIGLTSATAYTPLTISASYVSLVVDKLNEQPKEGVPMEIVERLTDGRRLEMTLDFGRLQDGIVESAVQVNLTAKDGLGNVLSRIVSVNIGREYSIAYDGNVKVVELYSPVPVSSCLPGGPYGRDYNYSGGTSESRSRSIGYSVNVGINIWIANIGFGFNVGDSVSSGECESLGISGEVLPAQYGVFYRQTQRLERLGQIEQLDICGAKRAVGEARVTDWNWAPDLAITTDGQCPPAPASNLPPAQVF